MHLFELSILPFAPLPVGRVYPGSTNLDAHLAGLSTRGLDLHHAQHAGAAIFIELDRLHNRAPAIAASVDADESPLAGG